MLTQKQKKKLSNDQNIVTTEIWLPASMQLEKNVKDFD